MLFKRAKYDLLLQNPYFATSALKFEYVADGSVGTAAIGNGIIRYNPEFIKRNSREENKGLLAHEVLHYQLLHHIRGVGKNPDLWNMACDYVVNRLLVKSKFKLPKGGLLDSKYDKLVEEQIYNELLKENEKENENGNDAGEGSNSSDNQNQSENSSSLRNNENQSEKPQDWGKIDILKETDNLAEAEAQAKKDAADALAIGKQAGDIPIGLEEIIRELFEPKQDWKSLLIRFVSEVAKNDYSWTKPNKRYVPMNLYLPNLESLEIGKVVFAIDTSGSINTKLLSVFISELKAASELFTVPVTVIHCDTDIQKVEEMDTDTEIIPVGRGGTKFKPVFDYVNNNLPETKALIYFTDGGNWDEKEMKDMPEPYYNTLWGIYKNKYYSPNFGEVINLD